MSKIKFWIEFAISAVIGIWLQLFLHELGHALFAIITGNKVIGMSIGVTSFANIQIVNRWSIPIISIGAFILPVIFCGFIEVFKNLFTRMLSATILTMTIIQLGTNAIVVSSVRNSSTLSYYDLGIVVNNTDISILLVTFISICVVIALIVWLAFKTTKIVDSAI